ncbi:MAG TPA: stalk domain-containing protein [Armatimonadota bacterium]|nr:stalk domain-containing protein [Armatimonadota bacterium]HPO74964.1 stalk domain-containing protein [Armatimonadota bacterium]HPT98049.1 stalk domain-containing protein [Armatimonadota bacterium]
MRLLSLLSGILLAASLLPAQVSAQSWNALRLISPRDGAVVSGTVTVTAEATPDLELSFVVFGIDGERPMATNARPFTWAWDTRAHPDGPHLLFVEAHGPGGVVATAGPVRVIVRNQPVVSGSPRPIAPLAARVVPPAARRTEPAIHSLPGPRPEVSLVLDEMTVPARVCLIEGNAYVPVRPLVECLDGEALWDAQARRVTLWCRGREVQLVPGSAVGTLNGRSIRLWRPPTLDGGRTILPARTFGQILDLSVAWDAVRRIVQMGLLPLRQRPEESLAG